MGGREVLLEVLRTEGVAHVFGNPGSTELPLIDALAGVDDVRYVLALQEATAVGIAEGHARATGRPAVLSLHTSSGVGNAVGALVSAQANQVPLVVTAGQQDTRHLIAEPLLSGNLTGLAAPVAKWTHEVRTPSDLGTVLRRAFHDAASPPAGPVFVSLPMDLLEDEEDHPVPPPSAIDRRAVAGGLDALAEALTRPPVGKVGLVLGDEVATSGAVDEAVALAEALGAPVHGAPLHGSAVFPPTHALWTGMLVSAATAMHAVLAEYDAVLFVGGRAFMAYPYTPGSPVPAATALLHLSADPHQLGRTFPARWAGAGDPKATLAALVPLVEARLDDTQKQAAAAAVATAATRRRAAIDRLEATARARYDTHPMDPMAAAHALIRNLPAGTVVVDEAITTGAYVRGFHHDAVPDRYFFNRGGGLGWGMPAAVGVSLGRGAAPVLCAVGDGSAMYSPQALWTAAHERLPVVFAVVNNRQYLILKNALRGMKGESTRYDRYVAMDLDDPPVDFVALAESMGVEGTLVEKAVDVGDAVEAAFASGRPHLLELPITAP
jgi:benzoylformate decarboxylase